ncbi:hypothetical protein Acr_00g0087830 [Actinidia rufa]|uniref:Uncharacterized protein n=1 Tax=Actinidia rufa TaxID=165716 RepID=A0A7J0DWE8_9ERIC|nr:hypothetical protein Acr_00g0087830 [Actinidia rufa]
MATPDEVSALELIRQHLFGEFSPVTDLSHTTSIFTTHDGTVSVTTKNSSSPSDSFCSQPASSDGHNFNERNDAQIFDCVSNSINFDCNQNDLFEFESKYRIMDFTTPKEFNDTEIFDFVSDSIHFERNQNDMFELEAKLVIVDLTTSKSVNSSTASSSVSSFSNRKRSLKIDLAPVKKIEWLNFSEAKTAVASAVNCGAKRCRDVELKSEQKSVKKVWLGEPDASMVSSNEMSSPLTPPSSWTAAWDFLPLSPHPILGYAQLMVL